MKRRAIQTNVSLVPSRSFAPHLLTAQSSEHGLLVRWAVYPELVQFQLITIKLTAEGKPQICV